MNITVEASDGVNPVSRGYLVIDFIGVNRPPSFPDCNTLDAKVFEESGANKGIINVSATEWNIQNISTIETLDLFGCSFEDDGNRFLWFK